MATEKSNFGRDWIIDNSIKVIETYSDGITLRQLYYRLVASGMINDIKHYKKVVAAMTSARWAGTVEMESFIDRERSVFGSTRSDTKEVGDEIDTAKHQIKNWMNSYSLERWSNQANFVEVWIEKKALQGVFERPCMYLDVALCPCKGYPSLTFLNDAKKRFSAAVSREQKPIILYFGDFDPSGTDIPRSIKDNLYRMGVDVNVIRIALNQDLIRELNLPSVPPKQTDSRTATWDGDGAVELDAIEPNLLKSMCRDAIEEHFDTDKYQELQDLEKEEREEYREELKTFVEEMDFEED